MPPLKFLAFKVAIHSFWLDTCREVIRNVLKLKSFTLTSDFSYFR